ncbi:MAG: phosphatase PAP2 family protein [Syntrophomonadaceae bacterium]|nr:phosphatase PAP2 family protein [Syntrophomonadaceae bacterium]
MTTADFGINQLLYGFLQLDRLVYQWVHIMQNPWLVKIMIIITYWGYPLTLVLLAALVTVRMLYRRLRWEALFLNVSFVSAWALMKLLKNLIERSRPAGEALTTAAGYSFPSGHAMVSMAFYGFLAFLLLYCSRKKNDRWLAASLFILIFLIGFSRIYLNVHYTSDVLAGFLFGLLCLTGSIKGYQWAKRTYQF